MVGIGAMLGLGGTTVDSQKRAFNIGLGIGRRFNVKTLGDGFVENLPPPPGETQVRYKNVDMTTYFIMITFSPGISSSNK
jgi:hypothetical protein